MASSTATLNWIDRLAWVSTLRCFICSTSEVLAFFGLVCGNYKELLHPPAWYRDHRHNRSRSGSASNVKYTVAHATKY